MDESGTRRPVNERVRPRRRITSASAVLLPFDAHHEPAWTPFVDHLLRTCRAGLIPALNMDTGFGPQLTAQQRTEVLRRSVDALDGAPFIAGAGAFGADDPLVAYRETVDEITAFGGTPIIFQSEWLTSFEGAALVQAYREIIGDAPRAIGFELGRMFAPFGRIYSLTDFERLLEIPALTGLKHSSLNREAEFARLDIRDRARPEFTLFTGNDLAIDMVMYGSDYLLGLSTCDPGAFAARDAMWLDGDVRFFELNDALQALGAVAFRDPVPAYKDSALAYLQLAGVMSGDLTVHPECSRRPAWEPEILRPLLDRVREAQATEQT